MHIKLFWPWSLSSSNYLSLLSTSIQFLLSISIYLLQESCPGYFFSLWRTLIWICFPISSECLYYLPDPWAIPSTRLAAWLCIPRCWHSPFWDSSPMTQAGEAVHDFIGSGELLQSGEQLCVCHTLEFKQSQILYFTPLWSVSYICFSLWFFFPVLSQQGGHFCGLGNSPDEAPTQLTLFIPFFTGIHLQPEPGIWLNSKPPEGTVHSLRFFYISPSCWQLLSYRRCTTKMYYHINRKAHSLVLGKQWTMNVEDSMAQQQQQNQRPGTPDRERNYIVESQYWDQRLRRDLIQNPKIIFPIEERCFIIIIFFS